MVLFLVALAVAIALGIGSGNSTSDALIKERANILIEGNVYNCEIVLPGKKKNETK